MGTPEGERDWVDVANDLLSKCHINLRLRRLTDCDANVFIALYENILGEKVPDYIAAPCSQEDDVHNVQSVIDSLSLDYLQISLSHITGENVVRGDRESIKNLLEIFDGLLEYLKEEISEGSPSDEELNDCLNGPPGETKEPADYDATQGKETKRDGASSSPSEKSAAPSSKHSLHSWNGEEVGSTSELMGLGVSARTFVAKQDGPPVAPLTSDPAQDARDAPSTEPLHPAIALQPPSQSDAPHRPAVASQGQEEEEEEEEETSRPGAEAVVTNGLKSPLLSQSPVASDRSLPRQQTAGTDVEGETLEPTNGGPRRVLFRTQPDVLFLTLQDEMAAATPSPPDTDEEEEEEEEGPSRPGRQLHGGTAQRGRRPDRDRDRDRPSEETLSQRRQRNKRAEEELHHISENLSHRLEELDQMLKRVLSEGGESSEGGEEDERPHGGDITPQEGPRANRQHTVSGTAAESPQQTRSPSPSSPPSSSSPSPSPSPPRPPRSLRAQLQDAMAEALSPDDGRQSNLAAPGRSSHRRHGKHPGGGAYEDELSRYEEKERADLDKARTRAQEAERQYREAILQDVAPGTPGRSPGAVKSRHRSRQAAQAAPGRRPHLAKPRPLTVKENELLPVLLEELPHLHISAHALGRMWQQQMQQVDRLHAPPASRSPHRGRLSSQLEEAQRKHDLLVELVRKEQQHHRRLRDVKERVQQQKSTQSRLREQRQQIARAKKYHSDYHVQHRARLMRARTKEERMFRQMFEEGLELQKVRLREQRAYAREQRLENQRRHQDHIESMENYYKDQFSLLAEKLAQEREEIQVRKKAQEKALLKMKRELRSRMEREISDLQRIIVQNDEDDHFQDLEVQRLRSRVRMASFQYNTSYLH